MFIVDLNQVMISNLMVSMGKNIGADEIQEDLLRHFVLNSIRSYNVKYKAEYGEMIIACDDVYSWRKQIYPYYKANRKKNREESKLDWNSIFTSLNKIRSELKEFFPYRVISVKEAEADDVIGTLCMKFANTNEKILIISGDKDFRQLQIYFNVKQYDPVKKKYLTENNPERYLIEHIIYGDTGDGIPNFLSADDCLVLKIRQKSIQKKKVDLWVTQKPEQFCDEHMLRGFRRNEQLIDLTFIPNELQEKIMLEFELEAGKKRDKLFNYFIENKLKNLMQSLPEF